MPSASSDFVPAKSSANSTRYDQMHESPAGTTERPVIILFFRYLPRYFTKSQTSMAASIGMNAKAKFGLKSVATRNSAVNISQSDKAIFPWRLSRMRKKNTKHSGTKVRLKSTVMLW